MQTYANIRDILTTNLLNSAPIQRTWEGLTPDTKIETTHSQQVDSFATKNKCVCESTSLNINRKKISKNLKWKITEKDSRKR